MIKYHSGILTTYFCGLRCVRRNLEILFKKMRFNTYKIYNPRSLNKINKKVTLKKLNINVTSQLSLPSKKIINQPFYFFYIRFTITSYGQEVRK